MRELSEHEVHLNSARINLQTSLRMIEEMLDNKQFALEDRRSELKEVINRCNWAVDYVYRSMEELKP